MINFISNIFAGATYPFRAIAFLNRHPRLWRNVAVPILLNILIGLLLYLGLFLAVIPQIDQLLAQIPLPNWVGTDSTFIAIIDNLLKLLVGLLLSLVLGFVLLQIGTILGSPWYGNLAEEIEKTRLGLSLGNTSSSNIARDIWRALLFEFKKIALAIGIGIPLILLGFVPLAGGILASVGSFMLSTTIVCLDFFDATLERRHLRFRTKIAAVKYCFPTSTSFGLVSSVLISIPLVNFVTIPLCVAAGTLLLGDCAAKSTNSDRLFFAKILGVYLPEAEPTEGEMENKKSKMPNF